MHPTLTATQPPCALAARRLARTALAALLALSLGAAPLAAFADDAASTAEAASDDAAAETAGTAGADSSSSSSASDSSSSGVSATVLHGLYAAASQSATANDASFIATAANACGVFAEKGATIVANALSVRTRGDQGAAVAASAEGGSVSIANSELATSGADAPLLLSAGAVEADNVTGSASKSAIAHVEEQGSLLIASSTLESAYAGSTSDTLPAGGVALFSREATDSTTTDSQSEAALFQASGSTLKSAAKTGSFFYVTNTTASIVLSDTNLSYDEDAAKLLTAAGSDAAGTITGNNATTSSFGAAGKNGATVTFTALDQELAGDIEVDSISSLDLYLLEGSSWKGSCGVTANSAGTDLATNIVVNIDATSGWVVTQDATVSTLNIAKGGSLVDAEGKAVTIVDADGNKLVDGASDVKVSVTNEFSTTVKTSAANALRKSAISRDAFDEEFGTSTAFGTNGAAASGEELAAELQALVTEWFHNL